MRLSGSALLLLAAAFGAAACGGTKAPPPPVPMGPVPVDARLLYDNGGGIRDSGQTVIRDATTLQDVWKRATSTQSSPPPVPAVDFATDMVLAVAGGRMSPSDQVHVDSAGIRTERTPSGTQQRLLAVHYTVTEGCTRINRDAYPVELVRIRKYTGEVRFVGKRERAANCR
ncbi:MAG: hypothetical protein FIB01_07725 [Gemmatimonadetes bacterium]|nr:hypothetical protein [Gemmatimonadota bacterium]